MGNVNTFPHAMHDLEIREGLERLVAHIEGTGPRPVIRRAGIEWTGGVAGGPLRITLDFKNPTPTPTGNTRASIEVASFGAFVPWTPLLHVSLPALPPFGRHVATATAGSFDPRWRNWQIRASARQDALLMDVPGPAPSAFAVMATRAARHAVHFSGNINVFVNQGAPMERHVHRAVALRAGCTNFAMFSVGDGHLDAYAFNVAECEPGWRVAMQIPRLGLEARTDFVPMTAEAIMAQITPPRQAESGRVVIEVTRRSTNTTVPVEFDLETRPAGAKCYFV